MIPRTFPSSVASNGSTQMIVYFLPSVSGLTRWVDYIPVKFTTVATAATENTYNQNGYIPVVSISSIAGATPFKEYVPVFLDSNAVDADVWDVNITGFIPVGTAGIGGAALYMDFAATTTLDPRVTFSRTTNATLTNSAGLVANAPMNLLTFSEQFDNAAWAKLTGGTGVAPVVTANAAAAPNGTATADQVVFNRGAGTTSSDVSYLAFSLTAFTATATASVWLKTTDGTTKTMSFRCGAPGAQQITVTGEWQRFTLTQTNASIDRVQILLYGNDGAQTASVYIWGAQLELGSTATTYNPTTVKNLLGFTENFDNAAWTKSNAFVQTNLLTYSQDFDNAAWVKTNATVTADITVAPDGTQTADKLVENSTNSAKYLRATNGAASAGSVSFYAKAGERSHALVFSLTTVNSVVWFNLVTGTVGTNQGVATSTSITAVGNGWYRCQATFPSMSANNVSIGVAPSNNTFSYSGDGTSGIYLWGAQLVQGTSAGDYKATYAAAAAVGYTDIYGQPFAQKLVEDTANSTHRLIASATTTTAPYTLNVYLKAAERQWAYLRIGRSGGTTPNAWFDLLNGTIGAAETGLTPAIENIGNGWYRCSITVDAAVAGANNLIVGASTANSTITYTGDGTSGIYIFGAQLSDSASVDPYVYQPVAAPTSTAYYGPRFDYDPVTLAPKGLLIEEQRTNLLTYSEQFDNAAWTKSNASVTANVVVSPDGTVNADKLVENTATSTHLLFPNAAITLATGVPYAYSVYAKAAERSICRLTNNDLLGVFFDLSAGTVTSVDAGFTGSITSVGNGWYRLVAVQASNSNVSGRLAVTLVSTGTTTSYTGNGTSGLYIWGAQLE